MESYQITIDSLAKNKKVTPSFFSFNPNYLTDDKAYKLGIPPHAIDRILAFRQSGKWFQSAEEFQRIAQINDSLMLTLESLIRIPQPKKIKQALKVGVPKIEINQCTASDLKTIRGIGDKLSERIIKYRNYLKFFSDMDQLCEVYGLDSTVVEHIHNRFEIKVKPEIQRVWIDTATQRDLERLPYISGLDARRIIGWRTTHGSVTDKDLQKIAGFDSLKIARISLYLYLF